MPRVFDTPGGDDTGQTIQDDGAPVDQTCSEQTIVTMRADDGPESGGSPFEFCDIWVRTFRLRHHWVSVVSTGASTFSLNHVWRSRCLRSVVS